MFLNFLIEAKNGKDVSDYTNYPNEDEVLLVPMHSVSRGRQ